MVRTEPVNRSLFGPCQLEQRYTFETFVTGRSNALAVAAAKQIAGRGRGEPIEFNPLFIHAGTGLGKTHLLQSIAWEVASGARKAAYLGAEQFMTGFMAAIRGSTIAAFKEALRGLDLLIVDDVQIVQGRPAQSEFCYAVNALIDAGHQVVIGADRSPLDLEVLDDRTRSRLSAGLVLEIGPLGEEMRADILRSRAELAKLHHPSFAVPPDVITYLAKSISHNGRALESAIVRLLARSRLTDEPPSIESVDLEMRDLVAPRESKRIRIEDVQRVVAKHYNVSRHDMCSSRRTANVVRPRQIAMYLCKTTTLKSLPEIGRRFGGRDHTTVLHAVRKMEALSAKDIALAGEFDALRIQIMEQ
ncbi:chromosomal replication initiator protein DnaA [Bradyrhizobium sp. LA6.12]|uniref:chromosomal replication initiator protein DnaA n=1 Tax=unclassified Bradyrhizobium TaxID=2631580 RepID=UPI003398453E